MNVDLKLLVRLLFAILLASLISTLFLGKHIHRQIMESVKRQIDKPENIQAETEIPIETHLEAPYEISSDLVEDSITESAISLDILKAKVFEVLKTNTDALFRLLQQKGALRDWHNHLAMTRDRHRQGLGEMGRAVTMSDPKSLAAWNSLVGLHGFKAYLSDFISVNRSLPDVRDERCLTRKYMAKLPNATVILVFHNEHLSVLLRAIHSLVNRSPPELLGEIILVDDDSDLADLEDNLDDYLVKSFGKTVSLVRLPERRGLIKARMEGARKATCEVLIFMDSHIEVTHNWLPPLLEPIAIHRTIATSPIVDEISRETFAYEAGSIHTRSGFNWLLHVKHLPPYHEASPGQSFPYRTPLLVGAMAIDRSYFWHLGGYDEELDVWGGEYLEMSFKIWMCGGMLLYIPCSRVGHISRGVAGRSSPRNYNFLARNYKRVAEVWMDDYKRFIYERNPEFFRNVDAGNLTAMKAQREKLKCKSFHWYMTKVAPDFLDKFPPVEPLPLASGWIQSLAIPSLCMDTLKADTLNQPVGLALCKKPADKNQDWTLTHDHEIRLKTGNACLEVPDLNVINAAVKLYHCHNMGGNQFWYYNPKKKWIQQGELWYRCLEATLPEGSNPGRVVSKHCNKKSELQRWNFGQI